MTKNNENIALSLLLLITLGIIGGGSWWLTNNGKLDKMGLSESSAPYSNVSRKSPSIFPYLKPVGNLISTGDKILIARNITAEKKAAAISWIQGNYQQAASQLESSLQKERNDPEALIYLNNARIGDNQAYTIAVVVPAKSEIDISKEILRGVAQAQQEINHAGGVKGTPLRVIIADDSNEPKAGQQVAKKLADREDILAVIGHFDSNVTLATTKIYQHNQLVVISPTSTSTELSSAGEYFFRTVTSDRFTGNALAEYLLNNINKQKAAVFYDSASNYSSSLRDIFTTDLLASGGMVVAEFDFAQPNFNVSIFVEQAIGQGAETIVLFPDTSNPHSLEASLLIIQVNNHRLSLLASDSIYGRETLQIAGEDSVDMVVALPWHILANPNSQFPQAAARLWGGDVSWRTALAYDATKTLLAAMEINPTRQGIQEMLSNQDFVAEGASGKIRFLASGDRNQPIQLVRVKPGNRSGFGYDFVPIH